MGSNPVLTNQKARNRTLWLVYSSASPSDSDNLVSLDRKRHGVKQNRCSASDSVGWILTRFYPFKSYARVSNIAKHAWSWNHSINFENSQVIDKGSFRIRKTPEWWYTASSSINHADNK